MSHYAPSLDGSKICCLLGARGLGAPLECTEQPRHEGRRKAVGVASSCITKLWRIRQAAGTRPRRVAAAVPALGGGGRQSRSRATKAP